MVTIAGRVLRTGDQLYNTALQLWGTVIGVDDAGTAQVEFKGIGVNNSRMYNVTDGGFINGKRVLFWHKPLDLDVPYADISHFQRLIELVMKDGRDYSK